MSRFILDCPPDDMEICLKLARDALRLGEEGDEWGYWKSSDPDFSAVVRFSKASISVRGHRKDNAPDPRDDGEK